MLDAAIAAAVAAAIAAGDRVHGTTSPNPPVGCAIVDADGEIIATGATSPVGGPHAEINALAAAGARARGRTAVVTLEPCNHTGRTGPCSHALVDAGIAAVYYLNADPFPAASGGADYLAAHGVQVTKLPIRVDALVPWLTAVRLGRPHVTVKCAQSLDGCTAAADGTSQWITGAEARRDVHVDRLTRDAIIIGTQTALADNPSLTSRDVEPELLRTGVQPARVVVGTRSLSGRAPNLERLGYQQFPTIPQALDALYAQGARDVLVEGGAQLAAAFFNAGIVDAVRAYIAPIVLGAGARAFGGVVVNTLADAEHFELVGTRTFGDDIRVDVARRT